MAAGDSVARRLRIRVGGQVGEGSGEAFHQPLRRGAVAHVDGEIEEAGADLGVPVMA